MGYYSDMIYRQAGRNNTNEPVIERTASDDQLRNYVRYRLGKDAVASEEKIAELKALREKAVSEHFRNAKFRQQIIKSAGSPDVDREVYQHFNYFEENAADFLKTYEQLTQKEKDTYLFNNFKNLIEAYEKNDPLLDLNQSDSALVSNYAKMIVLIGPVIQEKESFDRLLEKMYKEKEIEPSVYEEYKKKGECLDKLMTVYSELDTRFNLILNPMYPYIGTSSPAYEDYRKLADTSSLPAEFVCSNGKIISEIERLAFDRMTVTNNSDDKFCKELIEKLNGEPFEAFAQDNGFYAVNGNNALTELIYSGNKEFWIRKKNGLWNRYTRNEDGKYIGTPADRAEAERISRLCAVRKDPVNTAKTELIDMNTDSMLADDLTYKHNANIGKEEIWKQLLNSGGFYYRTNRDHTVHYMDIRDGRIIDITVPDHEWQKLNEKACSDLLEYAGLDGSDKAMLRLLKYDNLNYSSDGAYGILTKQVRELSGLCASGNSGLKDEIRNFLNNAKDLSTDKFMDSFNDLVIHAEEMNELKEKAAEMRKYQDAMRILLHRKMIRRRYFVIREIRRKRMKEKMIAKKRALEELNVPAENNGEHDREKNSKPNGWEILEEPENIIDAPDTEKAMKNTAETFREGRFAKHTIQMAMMENALENCRNEHAAVRADDTFENHSDHLRSLYRLKQSIEIYKKYKEKNINGSRGEKRLQAARRLEISVRKQIRAEEEYARKHGIPVVDYNSAEKTAELLAENLNSLKQEFGASSAPAVFAANLSGSLNLLKRRRDGEVLPKDAVLKAKQIVYTGLSGVQSAEVFRNTIKTKQTNKDMNQQYDQLKSSVLFERSSAEDYLSMDYRRLLNKMHTHLLMKQLVSASLEKQSLQVPVIAGPCL